MTLSEEKRETEDIVRRGKALYESNIRPQVETGNTGKFLVINVETGEYVMDADDVTASKRGIERFPAAPLFAMRVGYATLYNMGGSSFLDLPL